jgi:hypothetical protein
LSWASDSLNSDGSTGRHGAETALAVRTSGPLRTSVCHQPEPGDFTATALSPDRDAVSRK